MTLDLEDLNKRLTKVEQQKTDEVLTIVEILANFSFFGEIKKSNCGFAKNGQCSYYFLKDESKSRLPISANCRVEECTEYSSHNHIELTNMTCALCEITKDIISNNSDSRQKKNRRSIKSQSY
jgi:hypothetical protein